MATLPVKLILDMYHSSSFSYSGVLPQESLYFNGHSGLDPESSICELDPRFLGDDGFGINVKKR
jgi:hypothetical protein